MNDSAGDEIQGPPPPAGSARERLKTEIVGLTETLAEAALSGDLRGMLILGLDGQGEVVSKVVGLRLTEALGLCNLGGSIILRKLLA